MKNIFLYLARFLSACCIYLFIAKANIWLDKYDNTVLVFGYRFFLILAPLFFFFSQKWIPVLSFSCAALGVLFWISGLNCMGTILFSSGIAIGSYVIKYYSVKTPKGAAINAIIFNLGVVLSGLIIIYLPHDKLFLHYGLALILITLFCSIFIKENNASLGQQKTNFSLKNIKSLHGIAWSIIGIVSGILFMSMFSILPQYVISKLNMLPNWYGWVIELSAITVVLLQGVVMKIMQKYTLQHALLILCSSMIFTAIPNIFSCEILIGALLWVFILTLYECAINYLDTLAALEGHLLIKECSVGIGMALTVFITRSFEPVKSAIFLSLLGFIAVLFIAYPILLLLIKYKKPALKYY